MLIAIQKPIKPKPISWHLQLKQKLIKSCNKFISNNSQPKKLPSRSHYMRRFSCNQNYQQKRILVVTDKGHGLYSQYIPITQNLRIMNEFVDYFPYLKAIEEKNQGAYEVQLLYIADQIENRTCRKEWREVCERYLCNVAIQEMAYYYLLALNESTSILRFIFQQRTDKCIFEVFLHKIMEMKVIFCCSEVKINSQLGITIEKRDEINLQSISKTTKCLFCPICLIYDCQKHFLPRSAEQNEYQYVRKFDVRHKFQNKKETALRLFTSFPFSASTVTENTENNEIFCSIKCYKRIKEQRWNELASKGRKKIYSQFFKAILKMGIQLFYYNPCQIKNLFNNQMKKLEPSSSIQINCEDIFYYLIEQYNLLNKMTHKFYDTEQQKLKNQAKQIIFTTKQCQFKRQYRGKLLKSSKNKIIQQSNSICLHYFQDRDPFDLNCLACDCQKRGYCLPSCGCSQFCEIKLKGCRCKGDNSCWDNKCGCFKNGSVCMPEICKNCFGCGNNQGKTNWCQNNQNQFCHPKQTRIGKSKISGAGLGLFAVDNIFSGEFVIKYLGQSINSDILQKIRQNLIQNNLFYTFKLNNNQTIDSRMYGNKSRFINHSNKNANVIPKAIKINEQWAIVFHARKDIKAGEQILFNYNGEGELSYFKQKFPYID